MLNLLKSSREKKDPSDKLTRAAQIDTKFEFFTTVKKFAVNFTFYLNFFMKAIYLKSSKADEYET